MLDVIIKNASVIDGSGSAAFVRDVGIAQGRITFHTDADAVNTVDASGLTLTPGFIDAHSHGDMMFGDPYSSLSKLSQGITTQVAGQCGYSMCPNTGVDDTTFKSFVSGICPAPSIPNADVLADFSAYRNYVQAHGMELNAACFTGHGTLRLCAMGYSTDAPDAKQLGLMRELLESAIAGGSKGLSTGLVYTPGCFGTEDEIKALLKTVSAHGGLYATHVRNESDTVEEAEHEAIRCAKYADVPLFISHFKACGRQNWGKPKKILELFSREIDSGMRITVDHYPYLAGMTSLNVSIPPEYRAAGAERLCEYLTDPHTRKDIKNKLYGEPYYDNFMYNCGGFSGVMVSACPYFHDAEGMTVSEYAESVGMDEFDAYADILIKNRGLGLGVYFHMSEDDLLDIARFEHTIIGTDALLGRVGDKGHPRAFGTMPHAINLYVKEKKLFTLEQMIRRITGLPAERLGLKDRGFIAEGKCADVVLFDYEKLADKATYREPNALTDGIISVYVNGVCAYERNALTGRKNGVFV